MSLRFFHILFITLSALMCLVVGLWALDAYRTDGSTSWVALMVLAFGGGGFLVAYGNRFLRKTRKLGVAGLLIAGSLGLPSDLLACTVCLGNTDSLLRDGMNMGILALLGFAMFMIVSFAAFFIYLWRRSRHAAAVAAGFGRPGSDNEGEPVHA
jgi:hypothetical protein